MFVIVLLGVKSVMFLICKVVLQSNEDDDEEDDDDDDDVQVTIGEINTSATPYG